MWSPHCVKLFSELKVKVVGHRKVKNVFLVISRRRIVVESRDWCQNLGEINIKQLLYLTFWSVTYSFQDRPGSKFGPPVDNEKNRILNVQLIYMGYAVCETLDKNTHFIFMVANEDI